MSTNEDNVFVKLLFPSEYQDARSTKFKKSRVINYVGRFFFWLGTKLRDTKTRKPNLREQESIAKDIDSKIHWCFFIVAFIVCLTIAGRLWFASEKDPFVESINKSIEEAYELHIDLTKVLRYDSEITAHLENWDKTIQQIIKLRESNDPEALKEILADLRPRMVLLEQWSSSCANQTKGEDGRDIKNLNVLFRDLHNAVVHILTTKESLTADEMKIMMMLTYNDIDEKDQKDLTSRTKALTLSELLKISDRMKELMQRMTNARKLAADIQMNRVLFNQYVLNHHKGTKRVIGVIQQITGLDLTLTHILASVLGGLPIYLAFQIGEDMIVDWIQNYFQLTETADGILDFKPIIGFFQYFSEWVTGRWTIFLPKLFIFTLSIAFSDIFNPAFFSLYHGLGQACNKLQETNVIRTRYYVVLRLVHKTMFVLDRAARSFLLFLICITIFSWNYITLVDGIVDIMDDIGLAMTLGVISRKLRVLLWMIAIVIVLLSVRVLFRLSHAYLDGTRKGWWINKIMDSPYIILRYAWWLGSIVFPLAMKYLPAGYQTWILGNLPIDGADQGLNFITYVIEYVHQMIS